MKLEPGWSGIVPFVLFPAIVMGLWVLSVADYFCHEIHSRKAMPAIYMLVAIQYFLFVLPWVMPAFGIEEVFLTVLGIRIVMLIITLVLAFVMMNLARRVLYARSSWFLLLEFLMTPFGMLSLTPAIQQWENSDKS
ncbi:MAG: hypothetical protein ACKVOK_12445 [Flavobacteriales bacterium]